MYFHNAGNINVDLPVTLYAWSSFSKNGKPLNLIVSSAIPFVPKASPTALVTNRTIFIKVSLTDTTSTSGAHQRSAWTRHGGQNVCQGPCQFEHDNHNANGNSHYATMKAMVLKPRSGV